MNNQHLKKVILDQREEIKEKFEKTEIIQRDLDKNKLKKFLSEPNVLAILGVRRCGKSILSWLLLEEERFGYINFDDERLFGFSISDFDKVLSIFYELYGDIEYIILDEPQNIKGWELFVNRLRRSKKIIVTGSNSKLLSGELSTVLTGRYIDFTLYPFNFREYLIFYQFSDLQDIALSPKKQALIKNFLEGYFKQGGFPESYIFGREILVRIYQDIIEKDAIKRAKIKKKGAFKELAKFLISNIGNEISYTKLKNIIGLKDVHTVKNWVEILKQVYLCIILERYSPKLKEQIIAPKKVYCIDTGIAKTIGFKISEDFGRLMENIVAIELLRRKSYQCFNKEIYYWKDHQQNEVDFVLKKNKKIIQLIQVSYILDKDTLKQREIKSLLKASQELNCDNLLIITSDFQAEEKLQGKKIQYIPLWKWLKED